jgi:hypothetical protein
MRSESPLKGLDIRTAAVRLPDVGYIIACDLKKEQKEIPHAFIFRWDAGSFTEGDRNYDAHTVTVIEFPELGYVDASERGYYSVTTFSGMISGDILESSTPRPVKPRFGGIRSLSSVR